MEDERHVEYYKGNQRYSENLRDLDPRLFQSLPQVSTGEVFHGKYVKALRFGVTSSASPILDVGCGVGQVVRALVAAGYPTFGAEVSPTNLALAREHPGEYHLFDGRILPFSSGMFAAVGAFNVLEHVEDPLALLDEMTRVLRPGGRLVVSSPNFLRVFGWRDYHPAMRGLAQKWSNAKTLLRHRRAYQSGQANPIFEKMEPIYRENFRPDDDAITATSALDLRQYFRSRGYRSIRVSCVDRPLPKWMEAMLDLTPLRFVILNSFVTAEKP